MSTLRAGLIGLGVMGNHHARVLSTLAGVDLVGIVDPAQTGQVVAGVTVTGSIPDLLAGGVDYCVVAAPTASHPEVGLLLSASGVHALVEKPLAATTPEATSLADAFVVANLVGGVGHIERYNPALLEARRRILAGDLGRILQVVTRRQGPFPARIADVGVVKDLATHDVDLAAWVTGQPFVTVAAQTAHRTGREHEDMVTVAARLADGTITSHVVNWLSPFKERTVVITGEKGVFVADTLTADLTFHANAVVATEWEDVATFRGVAEGDVVRYAIAKPEPLRSEHEAFRDAVLGRESHIVTMREGLAAVRVAEAIIESATQNRTIEIGEATA